ncbi:MAG: 3-methyl-2-oxobutanoate hydroxymethyltransferase [Omnitrophica WOR_2 bacterium RIFCSPLOWO2_12_FULL_51_24]|nr:MAG: 3-methyl-2-oxobutanoate hydroxymethyltransferase [Omnitrophica WOR_2 bacterium RIFCSPLOWO2_12_FULL_51_24]
MAVERKKITIPDILKKKGEGRKITLLTAYDYPSGRLIDEAGVDIILIGDSLAMTVLGYESTVPITMDEMVHHAKAAKRGVKYALMVGDMPFMTYNIGDKETVRNAGRFIKEGGCGAVKIEGGTEMTGVVKTLVKAGIPVLGHIGLTPQTAVQLGGFKVQGKDAKGAQRLLDSALALEKAGCFAIILECVPDKLAKLITERLAIPTIGIGAGPYCDGQALVTNDMIGLFDRFTPRFVKKYADLWPLLLNAFRRYRDEVEGGKFPTEEHSFTMNASELKKIKIKRRAK